MAKPGATPKSNAQEADATGREEAADGGAARILKWLVPSAAISLAVFGYVVQSAQDSLLGVASADRSSTAYFNQAADFIRDSVLMLFGAVVSVADFPAAFSNHPALFIGAAIAAAAAAAAFRWRSSRFAVNLSLVLIASMLLLKFIAIDAPLLEVRGLVSGSDASCWALAAEPPPDATAPSAAQTGLGPGCSDSHRNPLESLVFDQARELFGAIVCSRLTAAQVAGFPAAVANTKACGRSTGENKARLRGEFLATLILQTLLLGAALALVRLNRDRSAPAAIALTVGLYSLSVPYAYGKIGTTQLFDSGDARISDDLWKSYRAEDPGLAHDKGWLPAVMLHRDGSGALVLVMRELPCPTTVSVQTDEGQAAPADQEAPTELRASLSRLSGGQLLSFDQIKKVDLVEWASQQRSCPGI